MSRTTVIVTAAPSQGLWRRTLRGLQDFALEAVAAQRLSRERDQLADLSDSALKDLGLTRADVFAELRKSVWQR